MQAGFAFLEAGLTRMKNVGHIAAKNVLVLRDRVDRLLPRRVRDRVRRRRQRHRRRLRVRPLGRRAAVGRCGAVLMVQRHPWRGRLHVRSRLRRGVAGDRLGRDGGAHEALGVLRLRGRVHAHLLRHIALDLEPRRVAVRQGHAGLRRLHRRPLSGSARRPGGGDPARSEARQVRPGPQAERDPRSQHGVHHARAC